MTTIGDMGEYIRYNMANAVGEGKGRHHGALALNRGCDGRWPADD